VHVFLIAKERGLGNPDGLQSGAMRVGITCLEEGMGLGRLRATQPFAVLTVLENVQGVDWRIAGLIGDTLGIHGLNQFFCAGTGELFGVDVKDVGIMAVASAAGIEFLWSDTGNLGKEFIEETGILVTALRLCIEARQLNAENGTLPLAQAIVRAVDEMAVEPFAGHAATVMDAAGLLLESIVIGNDDATLASGHQLAGLKTEGASRAV